MRQILLIVCISLLNFSCTPGKTEVDIKAEKSYAMLEQHCFRCHNAEKKKGKVDLESFASIKAPLKNVKLWRHALNMAEERTMPPEGKKQPTEEERQDIINWLKGTLEDTYAQMPDDPGRTVVRKLNRTEYENTLNDLLYIDEDHAADIPLDSVGYGFDNISDLLNIPPILMEKYLGVARTAVDKAVMENPNPKMALRIGADEFVKVSGAGDINPTQAGIYSNGTIKTDFTIKYDNKYKLTIQAFGTQAGNEPVKADIKVDGKKIKTIDVKNEGYKPGDFHFTLDLKKGKRVLEISFINDHYDSQKKQDRNLFVKHVNVHGPLGKITLPKSHSALISALPENGQNEEVAAIQNIKTFIQRAFRKNVSDDELARYVNLYTNERKSGRSFYQALKTSYMAALVSPNFLFRMEKRPEGIVKADNYELAVRLSYFLHSSMPDEQLLSIAALGELNNPKVFRSEVERLMKSSRLINFSENFSGQWLMLRSLDRLQPDMKKFPEWNDRLRDSMKSEAVTLFHTILSNNDSIKKFITNEDIYINETLAKHYGIPNIKGNEIRSIKAPS
ncbi:MAG: DUF1592 domain-containing protein, partial [Lentisphaeraceae bacterium]|nr:DUF1592 domain-containing protein [Lentisphaeraceae bacterium]